MLLLPTALSIKKISNSNTVKEYIVENIKIYNSVYMYINSNMYMIIRDNEALVIDPHENKDLLLLLLSNDVREVTILLTHEHPDHISGIFWLQEHFDCILICQQCCANYISNPKNVRPILISFVLDERDRINETHFLEQFNSNYVMHTYNADVTFEETLYYEWKKHLLEFYHIQGHSKGSCFIVLDKTVAFTGDSLMKDDPIITRFPGGNRKVYQTETLPLLEKTLNADMTILPGHGTPFIVNEIIKEGKLNVQFR